MKTIGTQSRFCSRLIPFSGVSVLDQFGDDPRPILEVALEQATPNRISKAWVRHRIEEVIGQLSTVLDDDQIEDMVQAFKRKGLI